MMHFKNLKQYYFIDKFDYSHLINLDKNISLIWRNKNKETQLKDLKKLRNFCKKYKKKLYVRNNIKLAHKINVTNPNTKVESEIKIEGLQSFFA